jgi:hypothetical protein
VLFIDLDIIGYAADIRFVAVNHHSDAHTDMLRHGQANVKREFGHGRMEALKEKRCR